MKADADINDETFRAALYGGDSKALGSLINVLKPEFIPKLANRYEVDKQLAEDWFFIGIYALWESLQTDTKENLSGYIWRVCHNQALKHFRSQENHQKKVKNLGDLVLEPYDPGIQEMLEHLEEKQLLWDAVGQLDEKCRSQLTLWAEDVGYQEIIQQLGYSEIKEAYTAQYKCLQKLKPIWENLVKINK